MKNKLIVITLLFAAMIWQACGSKSESNSDSMTGEDSVSASSSSSQSSNADDTGDADQNGEDATAKRTRLEQARVEKAEQRTLAIAEKAKASPTYKDAKGRVVYNKAEVDPSFTGGNSAMEDYLRENLKYPDTAREQGIEGTVFVEFVIDESGKVGEVVVADIVGADDQSLKDESVRVVSMMPKWIAGKQHGKNVAVNYSIPITFSVN
ncbi:MAG: energy transducer TonB [Chryseolinea sp.]